MSDFKISEKGVIKSANKNDFADIVIDGRGNLLLKNNSVNENPMKLTNVITAKDISDNLLSLRKLVDAVFSINLDDKIFRVYNKENDKTIFEGIYEKPNWIVKFEVKKVLNEDDTIVDEYDNYSCIACLAIDSESSEQSRTDDMVQRPSDSEGDNSEYNEKSSKEIESVIGREKSGELTESIPKSVTKVDDLNDIESLKEILVENPHEKSNLEGKLSEAMLWHVRLGHASLTYLKMLQKNEKSLQHIKFDESIRECEVCILSKMEKLPFKINRSRADRPLQLIHSDIMGPIKPISWPGQKRYIITFVDYYSRYAKIYCLKSKDEAGQAFESYLVSARNLLGENAKVCYVRSDRGTEYTGGKFAEVMAKEKI